MTFSVVTANTQGKSDRLEHFRHTVAVVASEAHAFIGWQEVNGIGQRSLVADIPGYATYHGDLSVPISVRVEWEVIDQGRVRTHHGRTGVTPARWLVWVVARHKATGRVVVFANTHYISGAWNNKPKRAKAWRRQMWLDHWQALRDLTPRLLRYGPVVTVGDFNRVDVADWHPRLRWVDDRGIDKVTAIDAKPLRAPRRLPTDSDHDARVGVLTI